MPTRTDLPEIEDLLPVVDVVDVKTARGAVSLREFTAGALGYSPLWLKGLFAVRMVLAQVLRLDTTGIPDSRRLRPETVSFTPGDPASFFTVVRGSEDHYVLLKVVDNHLIAYLAIITDNAQPVSSYKVVTLVQYLRPAGKFYYKLIEPFHHLVVSSMARAGTKSFTSR
jgi:tRNA-binding EMAP/Myf-like protein